MTCRGRSARGVCTGLRAGVPATRSPLSATARPGGGSSEEASRRRACGREAEGATHGGGTSVHGGVSQTDARLRDGRGDLAWNTGPLSLPLTRESWSHLKWRAGSRGGEGGRGGEGTEAWAVAAVAGPVGLLGQERYIPPPGVRFIVTQWPLPSGCFQPKSRGETGLKSFRCRTGQPEPFPPNDRLRTRCQLPSPPQTGRSRPGAAEQFAPGLGAGPPLPPPHVGRLHGGGSHGRHAHSGDPSLCRVTTTGGPSGGPPASLGCHAVCRMRASALLSVAARQTRVARGGHEADAELRVRWTRRPAIGRTSGR